MCHDDRLPTVSVRERDSFRGHIHLMLDWIGAQELTRSRGVRLDPGRPTLVQPREGPKTVALTLPVEMQQGVIGDRPAEQ